MHVVAYLTPKRAVAWKCLSLEASGSPSIRRFTPAAYASRSRSFFAGVDELHRPGVLWVVSQPTYKAPGQAEVFFPPTLTAKLVVDRLLRGDTVRRWADAEPDRALRIPEDPDEAQRWRAASSVLDPTHRAIFRITRSFALLAFEQRRKSGWTEENAWDSVRTAVANPEGSGFFAHVDAERCLRTALRLPDGVKVGTRLQSPRQIHSDECVAELEALAEIGATRAIFMNYRRNDRSTDVVHLARALLAHRLGVWLDGLAIPHYAEAPDFGVGRRWQKKGPGQVDLERLLQVGIERSALFLCLAAKDYLDAPKHRPKGTKNWAVREYECANGRFLATGTPSIRVIDMGGAPDSIRADNPNPILPFGSDVIQLASRVADLLESR